MTFSQDKPIYLQMCERLANEILTEQYKEDDRIPSVREYAASLGVNSNTAMKAYDELSRREIIYNRRGLGYFVSSGARDKILEERRNHFLTHTLPDVFRDMQLLDISIEEVNRMWKKEKP